MGILRADTLATFKCTEQAAAAAAAVVQTFAYRS